MTPRPFEIAIPDRDLAALRERLTTTRLAADFGNTDWSYGVERKWLADMLGYWTNWYDWRSHEAAMNAYPQWCVELDDIPIHFTHVRAKTRRALPLIVTHGWPWTFWDWHRMIGPLTDPERHGGTDADGFDLIIPSLPGFGFSAPLRHGGMDVQRIAQLWARLMHNVLGFSHYVAAGGDWGAFITCELGQRAPHGLRAVHMSLPVVPGVDVRAIRRTDFATDELWMADRAEQIAPTTQSHIMVHSRDPQTLAYALNDSPAGLAAWLWERRRNWSDREDDAESAFDADFLCTTASLYWFTETIGTSMRLYAEQARKGIARGHQDGKSIVLPTGYAIAPKDVLMVPRRLAEERTNLHRWSILPRGGHFLPAEQPLLLATEYREFFRPFR